MTILFILCFVKIWPFCCLSFLKATYAASLMIYPNPSSRT